MERINEETLNRVRDLACRFMDGLDKDKVHGSVHILETEALARRLAEGTGMDLSLVSAAALLHDAGDYKLTGKDAPGPDNALDILRKAGVPKQQAAVIAADAAKIGWSSHMLGIVPDLPETRCAADADACTIMGTSGIARLAVHSASMGVPFFDPGTFPRENLDIRTYRKTYAASAVNHLFEKALWLPENMFTEPGRKEGLARQGAMIAFLYALFREYGNKEWSDYLDRKLAEHMLPKGEQNA